MHAVVIKHVPVSELPRLWRDKLVQPGSATVTVRIEEESAGEHPEAFTTDDPAFGIWRDRKDMDDVSEQARHLRQARYRNDGTRQVA